MQMLMPFYRQGPWLNLFIMSCLPYAEVQAAADVMRDDDLF